MRKTETVTIDTEGRDKGKVFLITEMAADPAERWAIRAFFALMNTGVDLPDDIADQGMAGIAAIGLKALGMLPFEAAEPLLAEMWTCVQIIPDPGNPGLVRKLIPEDIEEVGTRIQLRKAVFGLHTGFFTSAAP